MPIKSVAFLKVYLIARLAVTISRDGPDLVSNRSTIPCSYTVEHELSAGSKGQAYPNSW